MPTINSGDFLIYKPLRSQINLLKEGLLVVIKHPLKNEMLLVKRIYKLNLPIVEVRGDNDQHSIDSRQFGIIKKEQVVGIVEEIIPKGL